MNLRELYVKYELDNQDFLNNYLEEDFGSCDNFTEIKDKIHNIFIEADKYAENNNLEYKYFQLAKKPLWSDITITSREFIYEGHISHISISLNKPLDEIIPFVVVDTTNMGVISERIIPITNLFTEKLNKLQLGIFEKALMGINNELLVEFKSVWQIEKQRIDKWIKTTKIKVKDI